MQTAFPTYASFGEGEIDFRRRDQEMINDIPDHVMDHNRKLASEGRSPTVVPLKFEDPPKKRHIEVAKITPVPTKALPPGMPIQTQITSPSQLPTKVIAAMAKDRERINARRRAEGQRHVHDRQTNTCKMQKQSPKLSTQQIEANTCSASVDLNEMFGFDIHEY